MAKSSAIEDDDGSSSSSSMGIQSVQSDTLLILPLLSPLLVSAIVAGRLLRLDGILAVIALVLTDLDGDNDEEYEDIVIATLTLPPIPSDPPSTVDERVVLQAVKLAVLNVL